VLIATSYTVESASVDFGLFSAWLSRLCPFSKHFRQQQMKIIIITSNNTEPAEIPVMMPMESEVVLGRGEEVWGAVSVAVVGFFIKCFGRREC